MIDLLVLTTLYPNSIQPHFGLFVEERLKHLVASGQVKARVVAPVPWFPSSNRLFGRYAAFASVPYHETKAGIEVWHPRYPVIPKVGMLVAPSLLARSMWRSMQWLASQRDFDAIDAHYFYPDGVAAVRLARRMGKPVAVTARGSDINLIAQRGLPRRTVLGAANKADRVIAVSHALAREMESLGVPSSQVSVLRNGVDLQRFTPGPPGALRRDFGLKPQSLLLSVGNLVENKGHNIAIEAVSRLPDFGLVIVGAGPELNKLASRIDALGLQDRVVLAGTIGHDRLVDYYRDAFALILPSRREGMPNVILEAMATGTPVVASRVGGVPELITSPAVGRLVDERSPAAFAKALQNLKDSRIDRHAVRCHARRFSWNETTEGQLALFHQIIRSHQSGTLRNLAQ